MIDSMFEPMYMTQLRQEEIRGRIIANCPDNEDDNCEWSPEDEGIII
jgi:hypothetical protein